MTKNEFIDLVASEGKFVTKEEARKAVNAFISAVGKGLKSRETITLVGFGKFSTVDIPEKKGKIPGTEKEYIKAAHVSPRFKFGKNIKKIVNE